MQINKTIKIVLYSISANENTRNKQWCCISRFSQYNTVIGINPLHSIAMLSKLIYIIHYFNNSSINFNNTLQSNREDLLQLWRCWPILLIQQYCLFRVFACWCRAKKNVCSFIATQPTLACVFMTVKSWVRVKSRGFQWIRRKWRFLIQDAPRSNLAAVTIPTSRSFPSICHPLHFVLLILSAKSPSTNPIDTHGTIERSRESNFPWLITSPSWFSSFRRKKGREETEERRVFAQDISPRVNDYRNVVSHFFFFFPFIGPLFQEEWKEEAEAAEEEKVITSSRKLEGWFPLQDPPRVSYPRYVHSEENT